MVRRFSCQQSSCSGGCYYTNSSQESVDGYVIAIKHSGTHGSEEFTNWELRYTDGNGVIDWDNSIQTQSIKSKNLYS